MPIVSIAGGRVERDQSHVPFLVTYVPFSVAQVVRNVTFAKQGVAFYHLRFD